jgi:hypothetical protein
MRPRCVVRAAREFRSLRRVSLESPYPVISLRDQANSFRSDHAAMEPYARIVGSCRSLEVCFSRFLPPKTPSEAAEIDGTSRRRLTQIKPEACKIALY